jgi:23S rRNA (cytidine1920-2'-O)/16S rRNA (cytidine1409-2'-O)-methyltransferase
MRTERVRLDELVVMRGLAASRNVARGLIMAGLVEVQGRVSDKAGTPVTLDAQITLKARPRFVSRAGDKLAGALATFAIDVSGASALDVGASTGGFVDCLLQAGASKVIALDVGHGQLDMRLRQDPRVEVMEGINARQLRPADLPYEPGLLTMDVSFISVDKILRAVSDCMASSFEGAVLVKPQFEAGREHVGKKGIVRDPGVHKEVLRRIGEFLTREIALDVLGLCPSSLPGVGGNVEFFYHIARGREKGLGLDRLEALVEECVGPANGLGGS